jgi:hypothetical protein
MFGDEMIDWLVLAVMVLFALGGVASWRTGVEKAKRI